MSESTEQREQGCDYCTKLGVILKYNGFTVYVDRNRLALDNNRERALKYINYCPMCGRKLEKEGV